MADRFVEVKDLLLRPVEAMVSRLADTLDYTPPLFKPGRPAVQSTKQTQVRVVTEMTPSSGEAATIGNTMRTNEGLFTIATSVPERVPDKENVHNLVETETAKLVDYYVRLFCNDVQQLYVEDVTWSPQIEVSNRTEYMVRLTYRYHEYPN